MEWADPFEPSSAKKALNLFPGKVIVHLFLGLEFTLPGKSRPGLFLITKHHAIPFVLEIRWVVLNGMRPGVVVAAFCWVSLSLLRLSSLDGVS